jgi:hypothetical protein
VQAGRPVRGSWPARGRAGVGGTIATRDTPEASLRPPLVLVVADGLRHVVHALEIFTEGRRRRVHGLSIGEECPCEQVRQLVQNYGEAGAVEVLGAPCGLPHAEPQLTAGGILPCLDKKLVRA